MQNCWMLTFRSYSPWVTGAIVASLLAVGCENSRPVGSASTDVQTERGGRLAVKETAQSAEPAQPAPKITESVAKKKELSTPVQVSQAKKSAGTPRMPPVLLSDQHRKSCKVFVGDTLPTMDLPDLGGKKRSLKELFGQRLTLVTFFEGTRPTEEQMLLDLTPEVADRYNKQGVAVVGIAVGQKADAAAAQMKKFGVTFPVLVDADRTAYDKVASGFMPRLFLVDASGKILWLDLEYSATTRRQIANAIRHVLESK